MILSIKDLNLFIENSYVFNEKRSHSSIGTTLEDSPGIFLCSAFRPYVIVVKKIKPNQDNYK